MFNNKHVIFIAYIILCRVQGCETEFFLRFRFWFWFQEFFGFTLSGFGFKVKKYGSIPLLKPFSKIWFQFRIGFGFSTVLVSVFRFGFRFPYNYVRAHIPKPKQKPPNPQKNCKKEACGRKFG